MTPGPRPGLGATLTLLLACTETAAVVGWCAGFAVSRWTVGAGLVATGLCLQLSQRDGRGWSAERLLASGGLVALVCLALLPFPDMSWDGMAYHLRGVDLLLGGYNPVWADLEPHDDSFNLLNAHSAQGSWALGAVLGSWLGGFEAGSAVGALVLVAALLSSYEVAREFGAPPGWAAAMALSVSANTVGLAQLGTSYLDGALGSSLSLGLVHLLSWRRTRSPLSGLAFFGALVLALGCRTSALPVVGSLLAAWAVGEALSWQRHRTRTWAWALPLLLLPALVTPYGTNLVRHGHPLWPLYGTPEDHPLNALRIARGQAPAEFLERRRVTRFVLSLAAPTMALPQAAERIVPKLPLTVSRDEREALAAPDARAGGFGPLFLPALVLALALSAAAASRGRPGSLIVAVAAVVLALGFRECWWARFVPWLWLVVPCGLAAAEPSTGGAAGRGSRLAAFLLLALVSVNAVLVTERVVGRMVGGRAQLRRTMELLRALPSPVRVLRSDFYATTRRLERAGVPWQRAAAPGGVDRCARPLPDSLTSLLWVQEAGCAP